MKKFIVIILLFSLVMLSLPNVVFAKECCSYCGQYFQPGDVEPLGICLDLKKACLQNSPNMAAACACMCAIDASAYMQYLLQRAKQKTIWMFAKWAMPFMPGVNLFNPDLRAEFINPETPWHRKMDILLGRSKNLMGPFGAAIDVAMLPSVWADPNVSDTDKAKQTFMATLPYVGHDTAKTAIGIYNDLKKLGK